MSADSFIRRASGLLVPQMSFAAPWLWLPCENCDCGQVFDCETCDDAPIEIAIDLTSLGLSDDECDFCDQITGVYVLTLDTIVFESTDCSWGYCVSQVCTVPGPGGTENDFRIRLRVSDSGPTKWQLFIDLGKSIGCGVVSSPSLYGIHLEYFSDAWTPGPSAPCMFLQDENGDVTVTYESSTATILGCTGTPPSTLKFSDAAA